MAVISVEVPNKIAKIFSPYMVVSSHELYEKLEENKVDLISFWKEWIWKNEFEKYLSIKDSI